MTRHWAALAAGFLVFTATACGAPTTANQTPTASASSQPAPSPSSRLAPLAISAAPFHAGEAGFGYTPVTPTAIGGVPPYTWGISDGSLPAGLGMTSSGKLAGTPTIVGTYLFTIRVADSTGTTATLNSSISISRRIGVTGNPCTPFSPCSVEAGCLTVCGVFAFQAGGIAPYRYKVTSGTLPTGMGLNGFSLTRAFPAPAPTGKDWVFTVRVTDAIGATAETTAKFHVFPHIAFTPPTTATCGGGATLKLGCTMTQLKYTLGTPGLVQLTVVKSTAPKGTTFTAKNGVVTGSVPPQTCGPAYTAVVSLVLVDTSTCAANKYCRSAPATVKITLLAC